MKKEEYIKQFDNEAEHCLNIDSNTKAELREGLIRALDSIDKMASFEIDKPIYNSELSTLEFETSKLSDGRCAWWYINSAGAEMLLGDQETAAKTITHWFFIDKLCWLNISKQQIASELNITYENPADKKAVKKFDIDEFYEMCPSGNPMEEHGEFVNSGGYKESDL